MHGSRVVGIEGRVDNERPRHRNTLAGAKMVTVMDGCTNGDHVDEVRVGHVRQVGHGVVLDCATVGIVRSERSWCFIVFSKKSFKFAQKLSDVVNFGVIYLLN